MRQAEDTSTRDLLAKKFRGPYKPKTRTFGGFIAYLRSKRRMTQAQYAGSVNISRRTLNYIEALRDVPSYAGTGAVYLVARYEFGAYHLMAEAARLWIAGGEHA